MQNNRTLTLSIVALIISLAMIGSVYWYSNTNNKEGDNLSNDSGVSIEDFKAVEFTAPSGEVIGEKEINEFFPITFGDKNLIQVYPDEDYLIWLVETNEYKSSVSEEVVPLKRAFMGYYGASVEDDFTQINAISYLEFELDEVEKVRRITDEMMENAPEGYEALPIEIKNVDAWIVYATDQQMLHNARILIPNQGLLLILQVEVAKSPEQFAALVGDYIELLKQENPADVVEMSAVLVDQAEYDRILEKSEEPVPVE